jgi:hypothetical protein
MPAERGSRWAQADRVLEQALELPPEDRARWLDQACGGDAALWAQVEALLQADAAAGRFLELAAPRLVGPLFDGLNADAAAGSEIEARLRAALTERYRIDRELGRGGMGTIYLAHDLKHERRVALKVLNPEPTVPLAPERFQREIRFAARLQHLTSSRCTTPEPPRAVSGSPCLTSKSYAWVTGMWRNADPELQPYVREARERLTRLTGEKQ